MNLETKITIYKFTPQVFTLPLRETFFLFLTAFIQTFFILLPYNSGKRVNFAF